MEMDNDPLPDSVVTATVTPAVPSLPAKIDLHKVGTLVRDIAMNMYDLPVILENNGLTEAQYEVLCKNEHFVKIRDNAILEWAKIGSTQQRLAMEAAVGIEVGMPTLISRLQDSKEPLVAVVQGFKTLSDIAGINAQKGPEAAGEKFSITINLGGETKEVITVESRPAPDGPVEIQADTEGAADGTPILALPSLQREAAPERPVDSGPSTDEVLQSFGFGEIPKP
jgi:hypothetical protein